jgi:hypothetical protein
MWVDVMAPDDVIDLDDVIFRRHCKACAQNVARGTPLEFLYIPKRAQFQSCYVWMCGTHKAKFSVFMRAA